MDRFPARKLLFPAACLVLIAATLLMALQLSAPQSASAAAADEWSFVGRRIYINPYRSADKSGWHLSGHTATSVDVTSEYVDFKADPWGYSYNKGCRWSENPSSISIGYEDEVRLDATAAIKDFAKGERADEATIDAFEALDCYITIYSYQGGATSDSDSTHNLDGTSFDKGSLAEVLETNGTTVFPGAEVILGSIQLVPNGDPSTLNEYPVGMSSVEVQASNSASTSKKIWIPQDDELDALIEEMKSTPGDYLLVLKIIADNDYLYTVENYYTWSSTGSGVVEPGIEPDRPNDDPGNVVVESTPPKEKGDFGIWAIPLAIVGVGAVTGGIVASRRGRKGDGSDDDTPPDDDPDKPSTFRMVLWKDFGDTLYVGGEAQTVGARIEEKRPDGTVVNREDLTARISFTVTENLDARMAGMRGPFKCCQVEANDASGIYQGRAVVDIKFTGAGGTFTNRVQFNVENLVLDFPDVALTFVAGAGQTFALPFRISDSEIYFGQDPKFDVRFTTPDSNSDFRNLRVLHYPDRPEWSYGIEMTECGPVRDKDIPGTIETHRGLVTATVCTSNGKQLTLEGEFIFFRFFEGLRFTCEPLKCYLEKTNDQEDLLVDENDALNIASNLQSSAMGLAGAVPGAVLKGTVETGLRKAARSAKDMFPELFVEDNIYVFDKVDHIRFTPARTHAYITLYTTDLFAGPDGMTYTRPCTPLPKKEDILVAFADVPSTTVFEDEQHNRVQYPVEDLDFAYFIKDAKKTDNTVTLEFLPTRGALRPPNRSEVDIAVRVTWKDRVFEAKQRVMAVSQPYRIDLTDRYDEYIAADEEIRKFLRAVQETILELPAGTIAKKGGFSVAELVTDLTGASIDHPIDAVNPVTGPGMYLYTMYTSYKRQTSKKVYYDDLSPMYEYIEAMIIGYDEHFGFYMPQVHRVLKALGKYESHEMGSADALNLALHGNGVALYDAVDMTVRDWNSSWSLVFARIGVAIYTAGASEYIWMPMAAISAGIEASCDYIDHGGDSLFEAFRVGLSGASWHAVKEVAIMGGVTVAGKCIKGSWVLLNEAWTQRQLFAQALSETFSLAKFGQKINAVAQKMGIKLANATGKADAAITKFRAAPEVFTSVDEELGTIYGRIEGGFKVDLVKKMMNCDLLKNGRPLTELERRAIILNVQSDKHAMQVLISRTGADARAVRQFFNLEMKLLKDEVLEATRKRLAAQLKSDVKVINTSGNAMKDIKAGDKVPMDMDATFRYRNAAGEWKDVRASLGQEVFDAEFYRFVKGTLGNREAMKKLARDADMTITDLYHPEAYSTEYDDVMKIVNANRAGEAYVHGEQVAEAARYKCDHWLKLAREAAGKAAAIKQAAGGNLARGSKEYQKYIAYLGNSSAFAEESARQFTKQADRLIVNRLAAMEVGGVGYGAVVNGVDIDSFLEKVALLKQSGLGRFGFRNISPGEADGILRQSYGTTLEQLYMDIEALTKGLNDILRNAPKK